LAAIRRGARRLRAGEVPGRRRRRALGLRAAAARGGPPCSGLLGPLLDHDGRGVDADDPQDAVAGVAEAVPGVRGRDGGVAGSRDDRVVADDDRHLALEDGEGLVVGVPVHDGPWPGSLVTRKNDTVAPYPSPSKRSVRLLGMRMASAGTASALLMRSLLARWGRFPRMRPPSADDRGPTTLSTWIERSSSSGSAPATSRRSGSASRRGTSW